MKILLINNTYEKVGGTEVNIYSIMNIFKINGHKTYFFAIDDDKEIIKMDTYVYRNIYRRGVLKYFLWFYVNPFLYYRLRRWIKEIKPDIIHIHNNYKFTSTILMAVRGLNIPIVETVHDYSIICPSANSGILGEKCCPGKFSWKCVKNNCIPIVQYCYQILPECINKYLLNSIVNTFITHSKLLHKMLSNYGLNRVTLLPYFIDDKLFDCKYDSMESGNLLYVGRLSREKGIEYLIGALPEILIDYPNCALNIIGDGPIKSDLIQLVKNLRLENVVKFYGKIPHENLTAYYKKANVVVIPSIWLETGPLTAYEAMASGRPVVGSNLGNIPELVIDGKTGLLIDPKSSSQISEKVKKILSNKDIAVKMGEKARNIYINNYTPYRHYNELIELYERLITSK